MNLKMSNQPWWHSFWRFCHANPSKGEKINNFGLCEHCLTIILLTAPNRTATGRSFSSTQFAAVKMKSSEMIVPAHLILRCNECESK